MFSRKEFGIVSYLRFVSMKISCSAELSMKKFYNLWARKLKFESQIGHISFVEIDHEIIATDILPIRWFQKGSYQLLAKAYAQVLFKRVTFVQEKVSRLTDRLDMAFIVQTGFSVKLKLKLTILVIGFEQYNLSKSRWSLEQRTHAGIKLEFRFHWDSSYDSVVLQCYICHKSSKHAYIILTPLNPTFI